MSPDDPSFYDDHFKEIIPSHLESIQESLMTPSAASSPGPAYFANPPLKM